MEVILKKDVENLGSANEIVMVKPGYGRNYLIPKGLAILATPSMKKVVEENVRQRAHKEAKLVEEAQAMTTKLEGLSLKIGAKAGESGKIFGSVNTIQLAEALTKEGFDIDRKNISIKDEPIKALGSYVAKVKVYKDITQEINFEVVEE